MRCSYDDSYQSFWGNITWALFDPCFPARIADASKLVMLLLKARPRTGPKPFFGDAPNLPATHKFSSVPSLFSGSRQTESLRSFGTSVNGSITGACFQQLPVAWCPDGTTAASIPHSGIGKAHQGCFVVHLQPKKKTTKVWLKTGLYTSYVCVDTSSGKWWNDGNVSLPDDCFLWKHGLDGSHPVVGWEPQNNGGGNTPVGKQMLFSSLSR